MGFHKAIEIELLAGDLRTAQVGSAFNMPIHFRPCPFDGFRENKNRAFGCHAIPSRPIRDLCWWSIPR